MIRLTLTILMIGASNLFAQESILSNDDYNKSIELYNKGREYLDLEDSLKIAINLFDQAIALNWTNSDFYYGKAISLFSLDMNDSAQVAIKKAIELAECEPDYLLLAANISFKETEYVEAINYYNRALECNKLSEIHIEEWQCYFNRGNSYLKMQEYASAISDFDRVLSYDSEFSMAYHNRAMAKRRLKGVYSDFEVCLDLKQAIDFGSEISGKYLASYCK